MANFQVTRSLGAFVENAKINFGGLYMRQILSGPDANQSDVIVPNTDTGLGKTTVNNWGIYDGVGSEAKLVANAQGMHTYAGHWYNWFTMVFEVERFKGSTLQVMGATLGEEEHELAIVGGTGDFAMARGVITRRVCEKIGDRVTYELTIDGFCRMKVPTPTKMGPWGGSGGSLHEMEGKSQHLESVKLYHWEVVIGIEFSYIGEDGQTRTSGLWGRTADHGSVKQDTIKFGPSEFVKQITGTVGDPNYLSKFQIVTNNTTYGPFGTRVGGPSFSYTVPEDETVVGFFVNAENYVHLIGVYTI